MRQAFPSGFVSLVRSGVVTHMVANPPSVDSTFAVAKAQDLPEVRFAAAFDDGTLLLGCPDGLPEQLAEIAQPIDPELMEEAPAPEAETEAEGSLANRLDALQTALEARDTGQLDERLARIEAQMAALADQGDVAAKIDTMADKIAEREDVGAKVDTLASKIAEHGDVAAKIDTLTDKIADPGPVPDLLAQIHGALTAQAEQLAALSASPDHSAIAAEIAALKAALPEATPTEAAPTDAVKEAFAALQDSLLSAVSSLATTADLAALREEQAALLSQASTPEPVEDGTHRELALAQDTLEQISIDLRALLARPDGAQLLDMLEELKAEMPKPQTVEAPDLSELTEPLSALSAQATQTQKALDQLAETVGQVGDAEGQEVDLSPLIAGQDKLLTEITALAPLDAKMQALAAQVATLAKHSGPADQVQGAGSLTKIQGAIEASLDRMETQLVAAADAPTPGLDLDALRDMITDAMLDPSVLSDIQQSVSRLGDTATAIAQIQEAVTSLGNTPTALAEMQQAIDRLRDTPAPKIDLTAQRKGFAQFATVLGGIANRVDAAAEAITAATPADPAPALDGLRAEIATLRDDLQNLPTPPGVDEATFATLRSDVTTAVTGLRDDLKTTQDAIANRVDRAADTIRAVTPADPAHTLESLRADIATLRDDLQSLPTPPGIDEAALETLSGDVTTTVAGLREDLKTTQDAITGLADRPAPQIDLSAQRKSVAQLATAFGTVLSRLEATTDTLAQIQPAENNADHTAIVDVLKADLSAMMSDIRTDLQATNEAINILADRPAPQIDLSAQRKSVAQLATAFGTALSRLETTTDTLAQIQQVEDSADQTAIIDGLKADVGAMMSDIRTDLQATNDAITMLADRPAPQIDLSAQRKSNAQFATALGSVVTRLEAIAANLGTAHEGDNATQDEPTAQDADPAPALPNFDIPLDDLRFQFAELIAQQIRRNAGEDS